MRALRALVGPIVLGAAAWCAAGTIATATPNEATLRYASPSAWWVFVVAAVLAALVPAIRRRPIASLLALPSTIPWVPIPLPPLGLLFTGPLAWLPIAVAVFVAVGAGPLRSLGRALGADSASRAPWIAGLLAFICIGATAWSAAPNSPGGDEPHYLVITQSLLTDGDIQIENNHARGDYKAYYGGDLAPHYIVPGKNGHIYSVHAPGLSVFVLPGFALSGYRGAETTVMLAGAITSALIWLVGWRATRSATAAWFAWAAIATSTTFLIQGFTIYPDGPAMLAVAIGTLFLLRLGDPIPLPRTWMLTAASVPLAALPWFHTRFSVIAAGFGAAIVVRLIADAGRPLGERLIRTAGFVVVPAVAAIGWFVFFRVIYGTFNPTAPYGDSAGNQLAYIPGGSLALLFDGQFGLLTYAPALMAAVAGWWGAKGAARRVGVETLLVLILYLATSTTYWMWWAGGPAPPARFFTAMLPVLAVPLAIAWVSGDGLRRAALSALVAMGWGFSLVAIGAGRGSVAWNIRDGQSRVLGWLGPVVNLRRVWPAFFWTLAPDFGVGNLGSEWRFAGYVALFVGVFVALWLVLRLAAGRRANADPSTARLVVGITLLAGLTVSAASAWMLHGLTGLDAAPAQARVLAATADGRVVGIGAFQVLDPRQGVTMTIGSVEQGKFLDGGTPWFVAPGLPTGDYEVTLHMDRPASGEVAIAAGERTTHAVSADVVQTWTLHVAADDTTVVVAPGDRVRDAGGQVSLVARRPVGSR